MGSKKIQVSFELTTEKEWREFIHRPGLIVVDLYRDWAGPCVAMGTPLKNLKVSFEPGQVEPLTPARPLSHPGFLFGSLLSLVSDVRGRVPVDAVGLRPFEHRAGPAAPAGLPAHVRVAVGRTPGQRHLRLPGAGRDPHHPGGDRKVPTQQRDSAAPVDGFVTVPFFRTATGRSALPRAWRSGRRCRSRGCRRRRWPWRRA